MKEFLVIARLPWMQEGYQHDARIVRATDAYNAASTSGFQQDSIIRIERLD